MTTEQTTDERARAALQLLDELDTARKVLDALEDAGEPPESADYIAAKALYDYLGSVHDATL